MIAVGDSGSVELIFHSTDAQRGQINKSATVTCNDATKGNFSLKLAAKIYDSTHPDSLTPVTLSDAVLFWDKATRAKEQKLVVKNVSTSPLKMTVVSQPYGFVMLNGTGEIKPGKTREIKVKVDDKFTGTDFQKSFTFELSDSAKTRVTVPVVLALEPPAPKTPVVTSPPPPKKERYIDTTKAGTATSSPIGGKH